MVMLPLKIMSFEASVPCIWGVEISGHVHSLVQEKGGLRRMDCDQVRMNQDWVTQMLTLILNRKYTFVVAISPL